MAEELFYNRFFVIYVIFSDYESTMQALTKHISIDNRGQVLKSSKEKLDEEILESSFLSDPSRRVKVLANHIFPMSTKVGLNDVVTPKQVLFNSIKVGGTR